MNRRTLAGLLVVNLVLLAAVAGINLVDNPAQAQFGAGGGDYVLLASEGDDGTDTVYIVDFNRGAMLGVVPQRRGQRVEFKPVSFRHIGGDVARDFGDR